MQISENLCHDIRKLYIRLLHNSTHNILKHTQVYDITLSFRLIFVC